jgi:UPF0271 protein
MRILHKEHLQLHHIKPHGALYNLAAIDKKTALVIIEVVKSIAYPLRLYVPYASIIAELANKENIPITYEVFADRNYNNDLTLVSRRNENAIITDSDKIIEHISNMLDGKIKTINGLEKKIIGDTFCIHGDNPNAVELVKEIRNYFD